MPSFSADHQSACKDGNPGLPYLPAPAVLLILQHVPLHARLTSCGLVSTAWAAAAAAATTEVSANIHRKRYPSFQAWVDRHAGQLVSIDVEFDWKRGHLELPGWKLTQLQRLTTNGCRLVFRVQEDEADYAPFVAYDKAWARSYEDDDSEGGEDDGGEQVEADTAAVDDVGSSSGGGSEGGSCYDDEFDTAAEDAEAHKEEAEYGAGGSGGGCSGKGNDVPAAARPPPTAQAPATQQPLAQGQPPAQQQPMQQQHEQPAPVELFPALQSIDMVGGGMCVRSFIRLAQLKQLTSLRLHGATTLDHRDSDHWKQLVVGALRGLTQLRELTLLCMNIGEATLAHISSSTTLQSCRISSVNDVTHDILAKMPISLQAAKYGNSPSKKWYYEAPLTPAALPAHGFPNLRRLQLTRVVLKPVVLRLLPQLHELELKEFEIVTWEEQDEEQEQEAEAPAAMVPDDDDNYGGGMMLPAVEAPVMQQEADGSVAPGAAAAAYGMLPGAAGGMAPADGGGGMLQGAAASGMVPGGHGAVWGAGFGLFPVPDYNTLTPEQKAARDALSERYQREEAARKAAVVAAFLAALGELTQLRVLEVKDLCNHSLSLLNVTNLQLFTALTASSHLQRLEVTHRSDQPLPKGALQHMFGPNQQLPDLKSLWLDGELRPCDMVPNCPLEEHWCVDAVGLDTIMACCAALKQLKLDTVLQPGPKAWDALMRLQQQQQLTCLWLGCNDGRSMAMSPSMFTHMTSLRTLVLSNVRGFEEVEDADQLTGALPGCELQLRRCGHMDRQWFDEPLLSEESSDEDEATW